MCRPRGMEPSQGGSPGLLASLALPQAVGGGGLRLDRSQPHFVPL